MRVLYDFQAFMQKYGGISRCFSELLYNMSKDVDFVVSVKNSPNVYLKEMNLDTKCENLNLLERFLLYSNSFQGKIIRKVMKKIFNYPISLNENELLSIKSLKRGDFDVFHPTYFSDYFLEYLKGKPFVLTIHDMIPELFPEYYKQNDIQVVNKKKLASLAAHIVAVSENTKKDIVNLLGIPESKITVVYHGGPDVVEIKNVKKYDFKFVLYVGGRGQYKNFREFLMQFRYLIKLEPDLKLVCTGSEFSDEEVDFINSLGLENCVIHYFVSSSELYNFYMQADAFVYPSKYEGFGIPILEAFACGCPVILNDASCFPEIAEDAALYFRTDEECSFIECYNKLKDREFKSDLVQKGYSRLKFFSWEKAAKELEFVYKRVLE